jgi:hypothetical protein
MLSFLAFMGILNNMAQQTGLYFVLNSYARQIESPLFEVKDFIGFLERYAKQAAGNSSEWARWAENTGSKVWKELNQLVEEGKVVITNDEKRPFIKICRYWEDLVLEAFEKNEPATPFPDEKFFGNSIPSEEVRSMDMAGFLDYLKEDPESPESSPLILRLSFPSPSGYAIIPACMVPLRLLECCMVKIKDYFVRHGNREYVQHKIAAQLAGRDLHLKEFMNKITMHPLNCINDMKDGREVAFYFWAFFCGLVKSELTKNEELLEDRGVLQSVYIIEACNNFYKSKAARIKDLETALKNFEVELDQPPYYFSMDEVEKFKDSRGVPLLNQYSMEELDAHIKKRTTEPPKPDELPDLLFIRINGRQCLMRKHRLLTLCSKLIAEARVVVAKAISERWAILMKNYQKEAAMNDEDAFDRLILHYLRDCAPLLLTLFKDPRLLLVHEEEEASRRGIPESSRLFYKNSLLPFHTLLMLRQKEISNDVKLLLPVWYYFPVLGRIIHFFQAIGKKQETVEKIEDEPKPVPVSEVKRDLRAAAKETESQLVPGGYTLDSYLNELAIRWGQKLDRYAQKTLVSDVNTLVRDKLRYMKRYPKTVSRETLDAMARSIIESSSGLHEIKDQNSLLSYVKLYLVKLISTGKS